MKSAVSTTNQAFIALWSQQHTASW